MIDLQEVSPNLFNTKGMKDIFVHDYGIIEWQIVGDTIENDLPNLINEINGFIKSNA